MKKIIAVLLATVLSLTFCICYVPVISVEAAGSLEDQKKSLDEQLKEIEEEQKALDKKISSAKTEKERQEAKKNNLDYQITLTKKKIKALQSKIDLINKQIDENEREIFTLEKEIKEVEGKVKLKEEEIAAKETEISDKTENIEEKAGEIETKEQEIVDTFETFKVRLRTMYMYGNATTLSVLLGADSFSDFLTKAKTIEKIAKHDNETIQKLTSSKEELMNVKEEYETDKSTLESDKTLLEQDKQELSESISLLESRIEKKETAKESLEKNQAELEKENEELNAKNKELKEQVAEIEDQIQEIDELEKQFKKYGAELEKQAKELQDEIDKIYAEIVSTGQYDGSALLWPVKGYKKITSAFGWRFNNTDFHTGIDIAGSGIYGTTVMAANGGTVKYVGWQKNGYGNYVIIDHGGGISTLYAHMSAVYVKKGDKIERGGKVGAVGSTGWSTGPHLHFEVRKDGKAYDPMTEFPYYPDVPTV